MPPLASQIVNSPSTRIEPLLLIVIFAKLSSCMLKLSLFTEACSNYYNVSLKSVHMDLLS